jgi:hypothetical protein
MLRSGGAGGFWWKLRLLRFLFAMTRLREELCALRFSFGQNRAD